MKKHLNRLDEFTRRDFASYLAKAFLGVSLAPYATRSLAFASETTKHSPTTPGTAKRVIYLYMTGGMSHLDTFDPKPGSGVEGPVSVIPTNADDIQITQYFPKLAQQMDKAAILRSLHSTQGAHELGQYFMRTGYTKRGTIQHPTIGSWGLRLSGKLNTTLPGYVRIGGDSRHPGAGFMEPKYAPLPIGDPSAGLQNSKRQRNVTAQQFDRRLHLANQLDIPFKMRYDQKQVRAYTDAYREAIGLMKSKDLEAFDINLEPEEIKAVYGDEAFGQGCLLARRLIEQDVRFVEVTFGGWDTHQNNFDRVQDQTQILDQGLSALLDDLSRRGLLNDTLVVLATEFGRTPKINQNNGRDHYPKAFSCLLAGGGVRGGQVYGKTSADGSEVDEHPVSVPDFNATIAHALGLPQDEIITSPSGRPFTVASKGKPVTEIFI